jgi:hypothetical protein
VFVSGPQKRQIHKEDSLSTNTSTTEVLVLKQLTGFSAFFRLSSLTSASCSDNTAYPVEETGAPVNVFSGTGTGSFGTSAAAAMPGYTISFTLGDYGDSSSGDNTTADMVTFVITNSAGKIVWDGKGNLTSGSQEIQGAGSPPPPPGSCEPSSSLSAMVQGKNVTSYVPKGNWFSQASTTGVSVVNVEGSAVTPTNVPTPNAVNSCASNPNTGVTVCVSNGTDVYLFNGTTLTSTLTDGGTGTISFTGGNCTTCSVAMDATHNQALIGISVGGSPGFQFLNLTTDTFTSPVVSPSGAISEDPLLDPVRNLLVSAAENNTYEIADISNPASPVFYENPTTPPSGGEADSSGEDCSTGIVLAPYEFSDPSEVFLADLSQATLTPGSPGTWSAPSQYQDLSESTGLGAGASGIAVAQGTHTGLITGEFGGNTFTAIALPTTSGTGTPAITDWITCTLPNTPDGNPWSQGDDPHTVTAYQSPNSGDAVGLMVDEGAIWLANVDLTQMLNPAVVPRDTAGHACASGTLPSSVVSYVSVP